MAQVVDPQLSNEAQLSNPESAVRRLLEELVPGSRFPTERALAYQFGASRSTIRHVLASLESEGRIERHVGRGTFVTIGHEVPQESVSPTEIMGARLAFEPSLLTLAAMAATPSDLSEIQRCAEKGAQAANHEEFESWDCAFHRSLAAATHNALILSIYARIEEGRKHPTWGGLKRRAFTRELQDIYSEEHERVVEALKERDPEAAQLAMRAHLLRVRDNVLARQL